MHNKTDAARDTRISTYASQSAAAIVSMIDDEEIDYREIAESIPVFPGPPLSTGLSVHRYNTFEHWFKVSTLMGQPTFSSCKATYDAANEWYDKCFVQDLQFVEPMIIPGVYQGTSGCFLVRASQDELIHIQHRNAPELPPGARPSWLEMSVYWYPNMAPFNMNLHLATRLRLGTLYEVINQMHVTKGQTQWDTEHAYSGSHSHWRRILWETFGYTFIIEYTITVSRDCFRGLDCYTRIVSADTDDTSFYLLQQPEAKYEIPDTDYVWAREDKNPADWYKYQQWRSTGQGSIASILPESLSPKGFFNL